MILSCPFCNAKASGGSTCGSCGRTMSRGCPHCSETVAANATICKYCGDEITPAKETSAPVAARTPDIQFVEEPRKKKCCRGGVVFLFLLAMLAVGGVMVAGTKCKSRCKQIRMQKIERLEKAPAPAEKPVNEGPRQY